MPALLSSVVYLLCVLTSLGCAWLLYRSYVRSRAPLLFWSALCFALLAIGQLLVVVDVQLVPDANLQDVRYLIAILAVGILLYGFVWRHE